MQAKRSSTFELSISSYSKSLNIMADSSGNIKNRSRRRKINLDSGMDTRKSKSFYPNFFILYQKFLTRFL